jgi:hypothetical protein
VRFVYGLIGFLLLQILPVKTPKVLSRKVERGVIGVRPDDGDAGVPSLFPSPATSSRPLSVNSDRGSPVKKQVMLPVFH